MDTTEIIQLTQKLTPISLDEISAVKLQKRIDIKYIVPTSLLPEILDKITDSYQVLEVDGKRYNRYKTIYYDTPDFRFFKDHHNKLERRIKVRKRTYFESDLHFFEIKRKKNDRTNKYRENLENVNMSLTPEQGQKAKKYYGKFNSHAPSDLDETLITSLINTYKRVTLVNRNMAERCTIDFNLEFIDPNNEQITKGIGELVVIEVKRDRLTATDGISTVFRDLNIRPQSFSKYINGMIQMHPTIKHNNFKPMLLYIEKMLTRQKAI